MVFGASCIIRVLGICLSPCYERLPLLAVSNGFTWHKTHPVCIYLGAHFDRVAVGESMRWRRQLLGVQRRKSASASHQQRNIKAPYRADITLREYCDNKSTCITIKSLLSTFCLCTGGCPVSVPLFHVIANYFCWRLSTKDYLFVFQMSTYLFPFVYTPIRSRRGCESG